MAEKKSTFSVFFKKNKVSILTGDDPSIDPIGLSSSSSAGQVASAIVEAHTNPSDHQEKLEPEGLDEKPDDSKTHNESENSGNDQNLEDNTNKAGDATLQNDSFQIRNSNVVAFSDDEESVNVAGRGSTENASQSDSLRVLGPASRQLEEYLHEQQGQNVAEEVNGAPAQRERTCCVLL